MKDLVAIRFFASLRMTYYNMRNISKTFLLPIATLVVGVIGAVSIHQALAGPSAAPPYNNVSSPINEGVISQVKKGALGLGLNLRRDKLDGNQLKVQGTTRLEGDTTVVGSTRLEGTTTVVGSTRLEGTTTVVGDTYANQFCLSGKGCINQLPSTAAPPDLTNYCTRNDTKAGCQGVASATNGGWEPLFNSYLDSKSQGGSIAFSAVNSIPELFDWRYEYKLSVIEYDNRYYWDFFCSYTRFSSGEGGVSCAAPEYSNDLTGGTINFVRGAVYGSLLPGEERVYRLLGFANNSAGRGAQLYRRPR